MKTEISLQPHFISQYKVHFYFIAQEGNTNKSGLYQGTTLSSTVNHFWNLIAGVYMYFIHNYILDMSMK